MYTQIQLQLLQFLTHITWSQSHILSFSQTWISLLWNVLQTHTLTYCSVVKFLHSLDFITDTYCLLLSYVVSRTVLVTPSVTYTHKLQPHTLPAQPFFFLSLSLLVSHEQFSYTQWYILVSCVSGTHWPHSHLLSIDFSHMLSWL